MSDVLLIDVNQESRTAAVATALASILHLGLQIHLNGPLGAGKTAFARHMLRALGYRGNVPSPTYTLMEPYTVGDLMLVHMDLYRLADAEEVAYLGLETYLDQDAVLLVEWAARGREFLPAADIEVEFTLDNGSRRLALRGISDAGQAIVDRLRRSTAIADPSG